MTRPKSQQNTQNIDDCSAARVLSLFVSSEMLKRRLVEMLFSPPCDRLRYIAAAVVAGRVWESLGHYKAPGLATESSEGSVKES